MAEYSGTPSPLQPQLPSFPTTIPIWKRPWIYIVAGIFLTAIVMGVLFMRFTAEESPVTSSPPPSLEPSSLAFPSTDDALTVGDDAPVTLESPSSAIPSTPFRNGAGEQVAINIQYTHSNQFTLDIVSANQTDEPSTIDLFAPQPNSPYSLVQLIDASGAIISENRFTVATAAHIEFFGNTETEPIVDNLERSLGRIVVSVPSGRIPVKTVVRSSTGSLLSEKAFTFSPSTATKPLSWLTDFFKSMLPGKPVAAQGGGITLVVINEVGAEGNVAAVASATQQILSVEPWRTFANSVTIVPIINRQNLGCDIVGNVGGSYPRCANSGAVISAVAAQVPSWDGIIVATSGNCQCGMVVAGLPPILAVGSQPSQQLLVHELGHSLGKMTDEYLYKYGASGGTQDGPNCFATESACADAVKKFPGSTCAAGCNTTGSWRPSTRIMHNTYSPLEFGPFEECLMGKALTKLGGPSYSCVDEDDDGGDGSGDRPNDFYGWHR